MKTNSAVCDTTNTMSAHEKMLSRMRNNPRDWRIGELMAVANRLGMECRNEGGSHHVFSFPGVDDDVCVPAHRPIKPVYVRQFVALVDKVKELLS
ncbi:hypothetical protein JKG47_22135 [Acidithiobacillus sp. MC6.1]|nr:hypothetical protein [Acidithiobacillus sp. MC6.1]